jgi:23S rRNA pseudouridine1911/1915/1917 synthase
LASAYGGFIISAGTPKKIDLIIEPGSKGERLDHFLAAAGLDLSRSHAKKLIEDGSLLVNNSPAEPSYKLKVNDRISGVIPLPVEPTVKPENIPLDIVYEDADIIVVNKPKRMVTHPAPGNYHGTLVNALLGRQTQLASQGLPLRPGIVHRLDKDTSGLLVVAKTDRAYLNLIRQFKERQVEKAYVALVHGVMKNNRGVIEESIGRHPVNRQKMAVLKTKGRSAVTEYKVLERGQSMTLVELKIKTGRTHQIRVHLSHLSHPLVGDPTYGKRENVLGISGQMLHAQKLSFLHPVTGKRVEFASRLPDDFSRWRK